MSDDQNLKCGNKDCRVSQTGKCVEGFATLQECPNYGMDILTVSEPAPSDTDASETDQNKDVRLASGEALSPKDAERILRSHKSRVIAVAGPSECGKTTLIAALYDVLQHGHFHNFSFVGSNSLIAFERHCHLARATSRRLTPSIERTRTGSGLTFLHLALQTPKSETLHLLLSDRPGEDYNHAMNIEKACQELHEIARGDVILILVDGERLVNSDTRAATINSIKLFIQALVDSNILGIKHHLAIVLTKNDLVLASGTDEPASAFLGLGAWIQKVFENQFGELTFHRIAARPTNENTPPGSGLIDLLAIFEKSPIIPKVENTPSAPTRFFHAFRASVDTQREDL